MASATLPVPEPPPVFSVELVPSPDAASGTAEPAGDRPGDAAPSDPVPPLAEETPAAEAAPDPIPEPERPPPSPPPPSEDAAPVEPPPSPPVPTPRHKPTPAPARPPQPPTHTRASSIASSAVAPPGPPVPGTGAGVGIGTAIAPAPGSGTGDDASSSSSADALPAYLAEVRRRLQARLAVPTEAKRLRLGGTVTVRFAIAADGSVAEPSITVVAGGAIAALADAAVATVVRSAPFPPPPKPATVEVPVTFAVR